MREVEKLTVPELCGQLLVVGFDGQTLSDEVRRSLAEKRLAGVILFSRNLVNLPQVFELCRSVQQTAPEGYPALVGIDQEGGRVRRLREGILQLPAARAFGKQDDVELTQMAAAELAKHLLALGFTINFAPVLDVDSNPNNPVIGDRSFGSTPALVTRHARAMVQGFQSQGLTACLKHFPGHGDTDQDSHTHLPSVRKSVIELRQTELYPFERIAHQAWSVMTAHVLFPAFDSVPATLSPRLLSTLLRREFAFQGVVFSDDLEMAALADRWPVEENAVRAIEAGCDQLLIGRTTSIWQRAFEALIKKAEQDAVFRARCMEAVERSLSLRQRTQPRPAKDRAQLQRVLTSASSERLRTQLTPLLSGYSVLRSGLMVNRR